VRRGAFWSFASTLLLRLAGVLTTAVIAHILDRRDFGVFTIALTVYTIVTAIGELGLASCLIRADLDIDSLAPTMTTVSWATSAIQAVALVAFARPIAAALGSGAAAGPIRVMAIVTIIVAVVAVPNCQLIRDFKQNKLFLAQVVGFVPSTLVLVLLAKLGSGAMAFAWSMVAGQFASGLIVIASVPKVYLPGFARSALALLWKFGLPLGLANIVNYALLNVDYALIGHLIGAIALGTYVLAFNVASWPTSLLGNMINNVSMPAFSRVKHDPELLKSAVAKALRALSMAVLPISTLTIALAYPIVLTLYGAKWSASAEILPILAVYGAISIICVLFANILAGLGLSKFLLFVQIIWLASLVPAMVLGVHKNGIAGAAMAHVAVIVPIVLPCYLLVLQKITRVRFTALAKAVLPALLASMAAGLAARAVALQFVNPLVQLITGLAVGSLIYIVAVAPQAVELLSAGRTMNPQMERVLRWYSIAARSVGLTTRGGPRHSTRKRSRQPSQQKPPYLRAPKGATSGFGQGIIVPPADAAQSAAAALELLISFSRPQPTVQPVATEIGGLRSANVRVRD
jgi:PST family polysaccharide transporter